MMENILSTWCPADLAQNVIIIISEKRLLLVASGLKV